MEIGKFNLIKTEGRARRGEFCTAHGVVQTPCLLYTSDVYKRQIVLDGEKIALDGYIINGNNYYKLRDIGKAIGFDVDFDNASSTVPVSYTHLDVYKRQLWCRWTIRRFAK